MKVRVKRWHAVAVWCWAIEEDGTCETIRHDVRAVPHPWSCLLSTTQCAASAACRSKRVAQASSFPATTAHPCLVSAATHYTCSA